VGGGITTVRLGVSGVIEDGRTIKGGLTTTRGVGVVLNWAAAVARLNVAIANRMPAKRNMIPPPNRGVNAMGVRCRSQTMRA